MYEIFKERTFSASHQLRGYQGNCERLHGHNWRVRIHVAADELDDHGMVIDFHELENMLTQVISPFDHRHLNDVPPFDAINPSSENLARYIAEQIASLLPSPRLKVLHCDIWESDASRARYTMRD